MASGLQDDTDYENESLQGLYLDTWKGFKHYKVRFLRGREEILEKRAFHHPFKHI